MSTSTVANVVFATTRLWETMVAAHVRDLATGPGWPAALGARIEATNPWLYMNG